MARKDDSIPNHLIPTNTFLTSDDLSRQRLNKAMSTIPREADRGRADIALALARYKLRHREDASPDTSTLCEKLEEALKLDGVVGSAARRFILTYKEQGNLTDMLQTMSTSARHQMEPQEAGQFCRALLDSKLDSDDVRDTARHYTQALGEAKAAAQRG